VTPEYNACVDRIFAALQRGDKRAARLWEERATKLADAARALANADGHPFEPEEE
jgi:predicted NBD/HSP70 family sugar kinase